MTIRLTSDPVTGGLLATGTPDEIDSVRAALEKEPKTAPE